MRETKDKTVQQALAYPEMDGSRVSLAYLSKHGIDS